MYDYVKQYLGDSRETREFAREFIEKRKKQREKAPVSVSNFPQVSLNQVRTAERRTRTFKPFLSDPLCPSYHFLRKFLMLSTSMQREYVSGNG